MEVYLELSWILPLCDFLFLPLLYRCCSLPADRSAGPIFTRRVFAQFGPSFTPFDRETVVLVSWDQISQFEFRSSPPASALKRGAPLSTALLSLELPAELMVELVLTRLQAKLRKTWIGLQWQNNNTICVSMKVYCCRSTSTKTTRY